MFFLALRHLSSRPRQTILIILGIVLGTTAYVVISGMMLGFQEFLREQLINNDAHIRIQSKKEIINPQNMEDAFFDSETALWLSPPSGRRDYSRILNPQGWFDRLESNPEITAFSPQLTAQVIFRRSNASIPGRLIGSDPAKQVHVTNIQEYMTQGEFASIGQSGNRIVVGEGLLKELGARVTETILISVGKEGVQPFKIVGSFRLGIQTIDDTTAFGSLRDVQRLQGFPNQISDIAIKVVQPDRARNLADQWASLSEERVTSWDQANQNILSVFKTQDIVRNSMTIAILVVAAFGIYNILSILVSQKKREIAILRSMGFESRDISGLFFMQGLMLGLVGGIGGLIIGYLACRYMATIQVGEGRLGRTGYMLMSYNFTIYLKAFALAMLSSSFASWLPARSAGKLTPINIIRTENS